MSQKYKYTQMRQVGGDDGYQWTVFVKVNGFFKEMVNGCTKREAQYYRNKFEKEAKALDDIAKGKATVELTDMRCPKCDIPVQGKGHVIRGHHGKDLTTCPHCKATIFQKVELLTGTGVTATYYEETNELRKFEDKDINLTDMRCPKCNRAVHGNDNEAVVTGSRGKAIKSCPRCKSRLRRVIEMTDLGVEAYFVDV